MRIEIGFGIGQTKTGKPISGLQLLLDSIVHEASTMFDGCNLVFGIGGWKPNGLPVVQEASAVLVISSAFKDGTVEGAHFIDRVTRFAIEIRDRLWQDAVVLTIIPATFTIV